MKRAIRILLLVMVLSVFALAVFANGEQETQGENDKIYIALNVPMTGDYSEYGKIYKKNVELVVDKINAAGGVLNKEIVIVIGDSKGDPKEAALLAQKTTSDSRIVAEIGDFTSSCSMAAQAIYDQAGMVQLAPTASHPDFAVGSKYSFSITGSTTEQAGDTAIFTHDRLGYDKIVSIFVNNDWGIDASKKFGVKLKELGGQVTAESSYFDGEKDFKAILTKVKAEEHDALAIFAMYNDAALIIKQKEALGWDVPIVAMGCGDMKLIELAGDAVEGAYIHTTFSAEDPRPEVQEFVTTHIANFNKEPSQFDGLAWDGVSVLVEAIKIAGSTDKEAIRDALSKIRDFPGVTGGITFTPNGDAVKSSLMLLVEGQKFVVAE